MPGCAAVGCNNRSEKGYIMKCFPRDPKLRKIWQERVARADWEPSNNSFLCHVHFEPQEWSITQSGRIRLKKNAIPSIFTITSTRKSPKKRIKVHNIKKDNISNNDFSIDHLQNDTECSSTGHMDEKDSDFHDLDEQFTQSIEGKRLKQSSKSSIDEGKEQFQKAYERILSDPQGDNIIMLTDDNLPDIASFAKRDNLNIELNKNDKEVIPILDNESPINVDDSITIVKEEIKPEIMDQNTFDDSYDEIEEKLKQICDGGTTEDENYNNESKCNSLDKNCKDSEGKNQNCDSNNPERKVTLPINISHNASMKNEIGHMLTDKRENVEIIFGTESGDEKTHMCKSASYNKHSIPKLNKNDNNSLTFGEIISIKEEKKIFTEDIEKNFTKDEVHVIPNMRAAMKRKRRTREEIMKSIKKSIRSTSDHDANSSSNSDLSEVMEQEVDRKEKLITSGCKIRDRKVDDTTADAAKFVIKVTGDPDDVTEIIEELSANAAAKQISQQFSTPYKSSGNDSLVTSVITVISPKNHREINDTDQNISLMNDGFTPSKNDASLINDSCGNRGSICLESVHTLTPCQSSCCRYSALWSDEDDKHLVTNVDSQTQTFAHSPQMPLDNSTANCLPYDCEELLEKMKIQEDVIVKLTDQLIMYKELETNLRTKSLMCDIPLKEVDTPTHKVNTRSSNLQLPIGTRKNLESKQRLIDDLSNRVNYFEQMNKKLMKTVTLESQHKRKLEGQIRQKENRIKELNWKLEKASKYLERAEKNTNTYRRKMLNMQTIMRRKKLLDEKMSRFSEMLIDSSKQELSEKALAMAVDIRKTCGRNGYDKLLSYGFPLPQLPALRKRFITEDLTEYNESDADRVGNVSTRGNVKGEKSLAIKKGVQLDAKGSAVSEAVAKETEFDGAETVTGTVQDIFEENNDGDDFSTNELREHFILQLNAVM